MAGEEDKKKGAGSLFELLMNPQFTGDKEQFFSQFGDFGNILKTLFGMFEDVAKTPKTSGAVEQVFSTVAQNVADQFTVYQAGTPEGVKLGLVRAVQELTSGNPPTVFFDSPEAQEKFMEALPRFVDGQNLKDPNFASRLSANLISEAKKYGMTVTVHQDPAKLKEVETIIHATPVTSKTAGSDISYGAPVPAKDVPVRSGATNIYTLKPDGTLEATAGGATLSSTMPSLGNDATVQTVQVDNENIGYFVQNSTGSGVYVGPDAYNLDEMKLKNPTAYAQLQQPEGGTPQYKPVPPAPLAAPVMNGM